jgi:hypothetical protein
MEASGSWQVASGGMKRASASLSAAVRVMAIRPQVGGK